MELELQLHVTIYTLDGEDRFKVMASPPGDEELTDVTEHYEVASVVSEDGRAGFTVLPKSGGLGG
jgi:hypothetical protein